MAGFGDQLRGRSHGSSPSKTALPMGSAREKQSVTNLRREDLNPVGGDGKGRKAPDREVWIEAYVGSDRVPDMAERYGRQTARRKAVPEAAREVGKHKRGTATGLLSGDKTSTPTPPPYWRHCRSSEHGAGGGGHHRARDAVLAVIGSRRLNSVYHTFLRSLQDLVWHPSFRAVAVARA
jgi:hypothetical protein